jgi:hypothetical protein
MFWYAFHCFLLSLMAVSIRMYKLRKNLTKETRPVLRSEVYRDIEPTSKSSGAWQEEVYLEMSFIVEWQIGVSLVFIVTLCYETTHRISQYALYVQ